MHLRIDVSSVVANWPDEVSLCVVGSFNNWGNPCFAPMTDEDVDNIHEAMIGDLVPGTDYEFKFLANEGWGDPNYRSEHHWGQPVILTLMMNIIIMDLQLLKRY